MTNFAPVDYFQGPTSLVMQVVQNSGYKGIAQHVAVASGVTYIASIWVRPDRDCNWVINCIPQSGSTVTTTTAIHAGQWNLVQCSWTPSANGYGDVQFVIDQIGIYEFCDAQFCRQVDQYDPSMHIVVNEWTRGGLSDDPSTTVTVQRFDDEIPYVWNEVLAETDGEVETWALRTLSGGALTYSVSDVYFPLGTNLYYRAVINHVALAVSSQNSGATPVVAQSDWRWLLIPTLPGRSGAADSGDILQVYMSGETFNADSSNASAAFSALGRKNAVVVSDTTVNSDAQTLNLGFRDANSFAIFERIRAANCAMLLRGGSYGFQKWIRFTGSRTSSIFLGTGNVRPIVTIGWAEVDPPESD